MFSHYVIFFNGLSLHFLIDIFKENGLSKNEHLNINVSSQDAI